MGVRAERKRAARERIVTAGARRLREEGLSGAAVGDVMGDAGLTHGAFYAHFPDKVALAAAAIEHALTDGRARWVAELEALTTSEAAARLAERYLNERHRDDPGDGCTFAALGAEVPRAAGRPRALRDRAAPLAGGADRRAGERRAADDRRAARRRPRSACWRARRHRSRRPTAIRRRAGVPRAVRRRPAAGASDRRRGIVTADPARLPRGPQPSW
jgi:AcrR family transcriptional regulator